MMGRIIKVFSIVTLLPIVFFVMFISFLMNDISLLNPFEWNTAARFAVLVWVMTVFCCLLGAMQDGTN